jgi:hypothetical protein
MPGLKLTVTVVGDPTNLGLKFRLVSPRKDPTGWTFETDLGRTGPKNAFVEIFIVGSFRGIP